jgi:hypothetical protein
MSNQDRWVREAAERAQQNKSAGNYSDRTYQEQQARQAAYAAAIKKK